LRQRDQGRDDPDEHPERPEVDDLEADVGDVVDDGVGAGAEGIEDTAVQALGGPDPVGEDEDDDEAGDADETSRRRMAPGGLDHGDPGRVSSSSLIKSDS
jgi:hypothetical protein